VDDSGVVLAPPGGEPSFPASRYQSGKNPSPTSTVELVLFVVVLEEE
jgi:hypothetical protein